MSERQEEWRTILERLTAPLQLPRGIIFWRSTATNVGW